MKSHPYLHSSQRGWSPHAHPPHGLSMFSKPVFFDPTGRRGRLLKAVARTLGALASVIIALFLAILVVVPRLQGNIDAHLFSHVSIRCAWEPTCSPAHAITSASAPELLGSAVSLATQVREQQGSIAGSSPQAGLPSRQPVPAALGGLRDRPLSIGFPWPSCKKAASPAAPMCCANAQGIS
jgi:hypothetical protein